MDDERHREPSIPVTAISSTSGFSTRVSTPALGSDVPVHVTHSTSSGVNSFAAGTLSRLGIPIHMADRNERGLHVAYEKYKYYLVACRTYEREVADGSWSGAKLTGNDLIELFVSRSFFHSHYRPSFSKLSDHPEMQKWLEGDEGRLSDEAVWGFKKASYQFKDLKAFVEQNDKKGKGKGKAKVKDDKSGGSSKKKKKDNSNKRV
jgi:hypothetical protein